MGLNLFIDNITCYLIIHNLICRDMIVALWTVYPPNLHILIPVLHLIFSFKKKVRATSITLDLKELVVFINFTYHEITSKINLSFKETLIIKPLIRNNIANNLNTTAQAL